MGTGYPEADDVLHLRMDERGAARAIAQHLYDLGHRDVALIQLPGAGPNAQGDVMNPEALDRTAGFLEVFPEAVVITAGESSIEGGYEASERLFSDIHPFTAIAAQSDLMAVGAIRSIGAHGLSTPADISVAGFDGIDLPWLVGTLTTIDQRGQEKGRTIADMVTSALAGTRENREHSFTLVQGTSTDAPPQHAHA